MTNTLSEANIEKAPASLTFKDTSSPFMNSRKIKWPVALFIGAMHVGALAGFFTFSWSALTVCLLLHWVGGGLGITLGYHRLLTHQSFKTPKWMRRVLATFGTLNCQGGPLSWVTAHRVHHMKSDLPGDPHSPREGFWWAHMFWCMTHNDEIDNPKNYEKYVPDLVKDPYMVFLEKYQLVPVAVLATLLYAVGGWPFVVWGIFVRTVFVYHCTWLVNSATHVWGYQTYKSNDDSRNLWWVALLSYGEGWHNNHHAFQTSARHGLKFWEIDTTYLVIKFLSLIGLAKEIKLPASNHLSRLEFS